MTPFGYIHDSTRARVEAEVLYIETKRCRICIVLCIRTQPPNLMQALFICTSRKVSIHIVLESNREHVVVDT